MRKMEENPNPNLDEEKELKQKGTYILEDEIESKEVRKSILFVQICSFFVA